MKITKSELQEIIRQEIIKEARDSYTSKVDGHSIKISYNFEKDLVNVNVKTPDNYNWSLERIPSKVMFEVRKGLKNVM